MRMDHFVANSSSLKKFFEKITQYALLDRFECFLTSSSSRKAGKKWKKYGIHQLLKS